MKLFSSHTPYSGTLALLLLTCSGIHSPARQGSQHATRWKRRQRRAQLHDRVAPHASLQVEKFLTNRKLSSDVPLELSGSHSVCLWLLISKLDNGFNTITNRFSANRQFRIVDPPHLPRAPRLATGYCFEFFFERLPEPSGNRSPSIISNNLLNKIY